MFTPAPSGSAVKTTSWKVVLPFYMYAALAFFASTLLLFFSAVRLSESYFHPHTLALTHLVALGWGTMIILGASYQLVPVIVEGRLYSERLAIASFILAGTGIPMLVYAFYEFNMQWPAKWGGRFILIALLLYLINLAKSIAKGKSGNVHAAFVLAAAVWLFLTAFFGLSLVYNFTYSLMPKGSFHYLPLHAHAGIVGWFLLLVIGVASRLIPMFLVSPYKNPRLLWSIFYLLNTSLVSYIFLFYLPAARWYIYISYAMLLLAAFLFLFYCLRSYRQRLRRSVDASMKLSLLAAAAMLLPLALLALIIFFSVLARPDNTALALAYGFLIFFGWITALALGMTFKTLPFIVWNKVYHIRSAGGRSPSPKDLFDHRIFTVMAICYGAALMLFVSGIFLPETILLRVGAGLLIATAFLYNLNVFKVIGHKPAKTCM